MERTRSWRMVSDTLTRCGEFHSCSIRNVVTRRLAQAYPNLQAGAYEIRSPKWTIASSIETWLRSESRTLRATTNAHHALYMAYCGGRLHRERRQFSGGSLEGVQA